MFEEMRAIGFVGEVDVVLNIDAAGDVADIAAGPPAGRLRFLMEVPPPKGDCH